MFSRARTEMADAKNVEHPYAQQLRTDQIGYRAIIKSKIYGVPDVKVEDITKILVYVGMIRIETCASTAARLEWSVSKPRLLQRCLASFPDLMVGSKTVFTTGATVVSPEAYIRKADDHDTAAAYAVVSNQLLLELIPPLELRDARQPYWCSIQ